VKQPCVYLLASQRNGTLYIGVHDLVWYEQHEEMLAAISREKMLKEWKRAWKLELIEKMNPEWKDLYESLV